MEEYSHNLEKNLEDLEVEMGTLNAMIYELLKRVSKEKDRGIETLAEVEEWISMAEETESKASSLLDESISGCHDLSTYDDISKISQSTLHYSETVCTTLKEVKALRSKGVFKVIVERAPLSYVKKMLPLHPIDSGEMLAEEAWDFFQEIIGETTLKSHPDIPQLARIVCRKCRGLPIALSLIGETMSRKRTVQEWHQAISVLVSSTPEVSGTEDELLYILKFAYDNLPGENIKSCFLYCALFPKSCDINKQDLVDCWIAEGVIEDEDREIAEIQGYEMMADLVMMRLLIDDESEHEVKMHDMVRGMALWIATDCGRQKENFVVVSGEDRQQMPEVNDWSNVRRMSVTSTQVDEISHSHDCPKLTTLFLQENNLKWVSGDFFRWMTSLVVLNLSRNRELSELPDEVSSLVSLRLLNLSWTKIKRLPLGLKELKRLIHLDLEYTSLLREVYVIGYLLKLQVLRLLRSVPMDLSLMVNIQLLKSLKELSLTVRRVDVLKRLQSIDQLASCIRHLHLTGIAVKDGGTLPLNSVLSLRKLDIQMCDIPEIIINSRSTIQRETIHFRNIQKIPHLQNIRTVALSWCKGLKDLTWLLLAPNLADLSLLDCQQIERIINKEKATADMSKEPFQNLTRLSLDSLPRLESIYWTPLPFPVLKDLCIRGCPKLKRLPFNSNSAKENQVQSDLDQEWIKGVEWEDEATKQHFSYFYDRDFPKIDEDQNMDGLASETHPIDNIVLLETSERGKSSTADSITDFDDRDFPTMSEDQNRDGLRSESQPNEEIVLVETSERGQSSTTNSITGESVFQSGTLGTTEHTQTYRDMISNMIDTPGGLSATELLKLTIDKVKEVFAFDSAFKNLASTMERILPIIEQIESLQDVEDLKTFKDTINEALALVAWQRVLPVKSYYTRKIKKINRKMLHLELIVSRHQLQSIGTLVDKVDGLSKRMDGLSAPVPVLGGLCSVPKLDKVLFGLDWPLMNLKKKLISDSVDSLLVSAPPGCGKTTLVTLLCHDEEIKGHFKHIFFNVVSSTPTFRVIVQHLLHHNGYLAHTFENNSQAAVAFKNLFRKLTEDGPILLVLDDVWQEADSLLNKFRIKLPGYKILVTSRFNLPSFDFTYSLEPLKYEHAKSLFIQCASLPHHTSPDEYEHLFQRILKRCNGFPIAIEVVGGSLKGQPLYLWKGLVESWSEGETILDNSHVVECLQPNFIALAPHLKECFMDMGSFLEYQKISASVLVDIWVELYGRGSSSSSYMCMMYLNDLASQNLLKLTPPWRNDHEYGFYNELFVTQHHILRELAIHQIELEANSVRKRLNLVIRGDNYPDWCLNQRQPIINVRLLTISTDDLFSSTWEEMDLFHFSSVEALVLNLSSSNYALPNFIATMKKLRVVIIINHGLDSAKLNNLSCLSSLPNLKRIRLERVSISFQDILQLQIGSLKKLSLVMCSFGDTFYDTEETDVSKALPSLQEIDIDYCYDLDELPYWISEALSLVKLSITNCHKLSVLPEAIGNLSKLEMLRLSSCTNLSELPETAARLNNLKFLDISQCLGLRRLPCEIGKLQKLKKISMRNCWRCELPYSVRDLEDLEVKCDEETEMVLWERLKPQMRNLRVHVEETEHNLNLIHML